MKKSLTLLLLAFICTGISYGQKQAEHWHFGQNASLNFNNDTVLAVSGSALNTSEGSASISDKDGNLLFYTDGMSVYNKTNAVVTNGTGLKGNSSSTQSALIIPTPGNSNLYYIFTTDANAGVGGFSYSVIDVTLDEITVKNQLLMDSADEQIAGTLTTDGGYWVLTHDLPGDGFYAYKISSTGLISTNPVISHAGTTHNKLVTNANAQMKFSKDGTKLALGLGTQNTLELYSFDAATGIVSNPVIITGVDKCYGVEFSAGGSKLYTTHYNNLFDTYDLDQYDISTHNLDTINGSKQTLINSGDQLRQLQLAPNGDIFIAKAFSQFMAVIKDPDSAGTGANFTDFAIDLDPDFFGVMGSLGLPNFLKSYIAEREHITFGTFDTAVCAASCINFSNLALDDVETWRWSFTGGTPDTSTQANPQNICYATAGSYSIRLIAGSNGGFDTLDLAGAVVVNAIPTVSVSIRTDTLFASNGVTWQWYQGGEVIDNATDSFYVLGSGGFGSYTVGITDANGCIAFSSPLLITSIGQVADAQVSLYPNPTANRWQLGITEELVGSRAEIYNANGQVIWQSQLRNLKSDIQLDVAAGIYMLRISSEGNSITRKLIRL